MKDDIGWHPGLIGKLAATVPALASVDFAAPACGYEWSGSGKVLVYELIPSDRVGFGSREVREARAGG